MASLYSKWFLLNDPMYFLFGNIYLTCDYFLVPTTSLESRHHVGKKIAWHMICTQ